MNSLLRDLALLAARRDSWARETIRAVINVRKLVKKSRKIAREIQKIGGSV